MTKERQAGLGWVIGVVVVSLLAVAGVWVFAIGAEDEASDEAAGLEVESREGSAAGRTPESEAARQEILRERIAQRGLKVRETIVGDAGPPLVATSHDPRPNTPARRGILIRDPNDPDAPPKLLDGPMRTGETSPELLLQRTRALQTLFDQRTERLTAQRAEAQSAGDTERVAHIDRQLEVLANQRPNIARRVEVLEQQVNEGGR